MSFYLTAFMNKLKIVKSDSTLRRVARASVAEILSTSADAECNNCSTLLNSQITDNDDIVSDGDLSDSETQAISNIPLECFQSVNFDFDVGERWLHSDSDSDSDLHRSSITQDLAEWAVKFRIECFQSVNFDFDVGERWLHSDSDSDSDLHRSSITQDLAEWAVKFRIPVSAVGALLEILKPHHPGLPKDPRTLLHTPTHHFVKDISGGVYSHLGLANGLSRLVKYTTTSTACLELQINVDGIPLFKSTNTCLWPILCSVINVNLREPFVAGVFCGKEKPGSATEFMADFVSEATHLLANGLTVDNKKYGISINSFVCDAPARAFLKGIKSHSGYASCEKCTVHGIYDGKVVFPYDNAPLRTDEALNSTLISFLSVFLTKM